MGKFIVCSGREAKAPFYFALTNTRVYTIEELCYYLYNNIYSVTEESFDYTLVKWLREQTKMEEIADKLEKLIEKKNDLKDIVVSILCSTDYYTEEEIKELILTMDKINDLPPVGKHKHKADSFLVYRNYAAAAAEYDKMIHGSDAAELTPEEYGNVLHNKAIALLHTASIQEAAEYFLAAYERNHNPIVQKEYFFALWLGKNEEEMKQVARDSGAEEELLKECAEEFDRVTGEAQELPLYKSIKGMTALKEGGRVAEYYKNLDSIICRWKQDYRREIG